MAESRPENGQRSSREKRKENEGKDGSADSREMTDSYEDIINLPHHVSRRHPRMTRAGRAAQFMPFAALSGYEEAIEETGRLTDERAELDGEVRSLLDEKLRILQAREAEGPGVQIICFRPDERKAGGAYVTVSGRVKKIDIYGRKVCLRNGTEIPVDEIFGIEMTDEPDMPFGNLS